MTGLPRNIIKKYGVTKKAWAVFRGGRRSSHKTRSVMRVAKRRGHRRSARGTLGGLGSMKNIVGTVGGAMLAKYAGINPRFGGALGAYLYGKTGLLGAGVGYVAAPIATSITDKFLGPTMAGLGINPYTI
jgi:hypothetical protein